VVVTLIEVNGEIPSDPSAPSAPSAGIGIQLPSPSKSSPVAQIVPAFVSTVCGPTARFVAVHQLEHRQV